MTEKNFSPDASKAREILDKLWLTALKDENPKQDEDIDRLVNSSYVAIRYCLPTQLLGKLTDNKLDALCLQKGTTEDDSCWDPRGFASKVIVSWVAENQNVLGSSADPYVGKPLRKPRIEESPRNVKGREEWTLLYKILEEVERKSSTSFTKKKLLQTLTSIRSCLDDMTFEYPVPERLSLEQTQYLINRFLTEPSGGDRGLSVAAALFETFKTYFNIYREVKRHKINVSDVSSGNSGDIECIDDENQVRLAIEVKERNVTVRDLRSSILKARNSSLTELLINAPGVKADEENEVKELISKTWASGTNVYTLTIDELIKVGLSLAGENGRINFIKNVGEQLDQYNTQPINRKRWKEMLEEI